MKEVTEILEAIASMTVLEISELVKAMEEKGFGDYAIPEIYRAAEAEIQALALRTESTYEKAWAEKEAELERLEDKVEWLKGLIRYMCSRSKQ